MGDAVSTQVEYYSQQRTEVTAKDSIHQRHISSHVVHFTIPGMEITINLLTPPHNPNVANNIITKYR